MAQLRRILGIVVLIIGVIIVALAYTVTNSSSITVPPLTQGSEATFGPQTFGSASATLKWSGATATTVVTVYSCPDSSCSTGLTQLANGTGASGSLTITVSSGHSYAVTETGDSAGVAVTTTLLGFGLLALIGVILAVVGVILTVLPSKAPKPMEEEAEPEPSEDEHTHEAMMPGSAESEPTSSSEASAAPAASGQRANRKCTHCGTMNEPWITNCRWCKRPLSTTNQ